MEDPDRPGDHACPHTLVTSIPDGIHKHKHTHNVNRWIEGKPERLKYGIPDAYSRRITDEHRLVYLVDGDDLVVLQCRYHYGSEAPPQADK